MERINAGLLKRARIEPDDTNPVAHDETETIRLHHMFDTVLVDL